jgi:hypothetical protein
MARSYRRWPADNRPQDGFVLVAVHSSGDRATVQIQPYRLANELGTPSPTGKEFAIAEALFYASVEAAKGGLVVYVDLAQGAEWDPALGRLID